MTRESGSLLAKKEQTKKTKKMEELSKKQKKNVDSDDDDNNDDDGNDFISESDSDEMDVHEYRKFLSKIFPSKHLNKKIEAGEKIKKKFKKMEKQQLDEDEDESSDDEHEYVDSKKKKNNKKAKSSKPSSKKGANKKRIEIVEEEDEEEWETEEDDDEASEEDDDDENIITTRSKSKAKKNKMSSKQHIKKERRKHEDEDDEEEDEYDDDDDEDEIPIKGSEKLNIIFTIGGTEDEDEWDDDDSDYDDDELGGDETEDEDVSVSSDDSSEEDKSDDDEELVNRKKAITKKPAKKTQKTKNQPNENKEITTNDENSNSLLEKMNKLLEEDPKNTILKKCVNICESDIKRSVAKKEKKEKKQKAKNGRIFKKILRDKNTMNDFKFFENLEFDYQKKIIKELREINKLTRIEKPYRMTLLESNIPPLFKGAAMKKINSLRYMEPGSGEFYKIKNWVDTFMRIPFDKHESLPISIEDGVDKCHEFMANAQKTLDSAVYGLNDAKMQIMQMLGQLLTNPKAIGTAIAIHGPPGTGKTSLVKEGISKILNRPFAFIALGGATDSSFLEGHSYTYEGSTWGKIVQILIDSKCMNPVIYFDELDKISDTPRGEEIAGILTHLTDTTQNCQFHDKYFAEINFDLSKCLFIFSYNDESKVNPILKDRMYRIQTKGYNQKQKTQIANNYLLPTIKEQVRFNEGDIIIPDEVIQYIVDNYCNKEDGVRNLKRCLEIIHTKLNLYRLMKPGTNLFEEDMSLTVSFPFTVTKEIVDKLIKINKENVSALYNMYV
uniref:ATPase AAA-type core domain-containing protein n=1 Tax=viral metagenome TaxID=1070528 RepID=A0A6C0DIF7_9ZZZZ